VSESERAGGNVLAFSPRVGVRRPKTWVEAASPARRKDGGRKLNLAILRPGRTMDITWLTERIGLGGGIWTSANMALVAGAGVTHIIDMQIEFDDTPLAGAHGIAVCWNPIDDDFELKPPEVFERGVEFALRALDDPGAKLFIHCAAGVHRAPMMALAMLCVLGWELEDAAQLIEKKRDVADFADVYVRSVQRYLAGR
jgi:hypothetical protein